MTSLVGTRQPESDRKVLPRGTALVLTIIAHLLLLLLLLRLSPPIPGRPNSTGNLTTFNVGPEAEPQARPSHAAHAHKAAAAAASAALRPPPPPPIKVPSVGPAEPWTLTPGLEHFDIRQLPHTAAAAAPAQQSAEAGPQGDDSSAVAGGSYEGEQLYNAEWYREPTQAELSFYLPRNGHGGQALIACRTVARFHVEDCKPMGESPPGSGLARALINASWQFLVRPPRRNGKTLVGAPVQILFTLTERGEVVTGRE